MECSGAPDALNEAMEMVNRGGRICLAAFPGEPVPVDLAKLVRNNIYVYDNTPNQTPPPPPPKKTQKKP